MQGLELRPQKPEFRTPQSQKTGVANFCSSQIFIPFSITQCLSRRSHSVKQCVCVNKRVFFRYFNSSVNQEQA